MQQYEQNKTRRILHIFGCMNRGGAEMRTLDLMRRIDRERFHFDFCSLSGEKGILDSEIRELGGEVHYCKLRSLSFNRRFCKLLRAERYDIVHSHVHYFSGYILRLAHKCAVPGRIAHFRNTIDVQEKTFRRKLQTALMRFLIDRHATSILAVGKGAMETAWRPDWTNDPRCMVIPNGLDIDPFKEDVHSDQIKQEIGLPVNCKLLIHVGRMAVQKNHVRLAEILAEILAEDNNVYALLVGKQNKAMKAVIVEKLKQKAVLDRVIFTGVRNDVPRLLKFSDILLFPSLWEGLPGVVLEACAAGTPVLASDIPGIRELADAFASVQLMSLKQDNADWCHAVQNILKKDITIKERREALGQFNSTPYSINHALSMYEAVFEK